MRLHVRSSTSRGWNDGADPEQELKAYEWTHVTVTHKEGEFKVYFNGKEEVSEALPEPLPNDGPLYAGNPWNRPSPVFIADLRYMDNVIGPDTIKSIVKEKRFQGYMPAAVTVVDNKPVAPVRNSPYLSASDFGPTFAYSFALWLKPLARVDGWANIFHKGDQDMNRNPAMWFWPDSTRLHIRSGTRSGWDDGLDPKQDLPLDEWTHVAVIHHHGRLEVFYNGKSVAKDWRFQPTQNNGQMRLSDQWYPAASCVVSDFRYWRGVIAHSTLDQVLTERRHPD